MSRISDLENLLQGEGHRLDALEGALADVQRNSGTVRSGDRLDEQEARIKHLEALLQASSDDPAAQKARAARRVSPVALRAVSNLNSVSLPRRAQVLEASSVEGAVSNLISVSPPRRGKRARPLHEEVLKRQALEANSLQGLVEEGDDEPWKGQKPISVPKPASFTARGLSDRKTAEIVNLDGAEADEWLTGEGTGTMFALDEEAEGTTPKRSRATPKKAVHPAKVRVTKPTARQSSSTAPTSRLASGLDGDLGDGVTKLTKDEGEGEGVTMLTRDEETPKKSGHPAKARATKSKAQSTLVQTDLMEPAADAADADDSPAHSRKARRTRRRARAKPFPQGGPRLRRGRVPSMLVHTDPLEPAADPTDTYDEAEAARAADHEEVDEGDDEEEEEAEDELAGRSTDDA